MSVQMSRNKSTGSVFSVVIKPFKSTDGPPPLIAEDRFPSRIKKIIEDARERAYFEAGLDAPEDEDEIEYHSDVAYAIEALHGCTSPVDIYDYDWDSEY